MRKIIIPICIVVALAIISAVYMYNNNGLLGNAHIKFNESSNNQTDFSFIAKKGQSIKFEFTSTIKSGILQCNLYNSADNLIYTLDSAEKLQVQYNIPEDDNYTLCLRYDNFIGNADLKVYSISECFFRYSCIIN